ncbi:MAG: hypothetical protein ABI855_19050, partial [Bacteroidota bacterium]
KVIGGKEYIVSTFEIMRNGTKRFCINSWFVKKDTNLETIMQLAKAEDDDKLKEELDKKINENKSWMKIVYSDPSFLGGKKYKKAGIIVSERESFMPVKRKNKK